MEQLDHQLLAHVDAVGSKVDSMADGVHLLSQQVGCIADTSEALQERLRAGFDSMGSL